ncbi:hypothetical protein L218DRAFT_957173, partial [Marasmius fiardii PR-910]
MTRFVLFLHDPTSRQPLWPTTNRDSNSIYQAYGRANAVMVATIIIRIFLEYRVQKRRSSSI